MIACVRVIEVRVSVCVLLWRCVRVERFGVSELSVSIRVTSVDGYVHEAPAQYVAPFQKQERSLTKRNFRAEAGSGHTRWTVRWG